MGARLSKLTNYVMVVLMLVFESEARLISEFRVRISGVQISTAFIYMATATAVAICLLGPSRSRSIPFKVSLFVPTQMLIILLHV